MREVEEIGEDEPDFGGSDEDMPPPPPEETFPTQVLGTMEVDPPESVTPAGGNLLVDLPPPITSTIVGKAPPANYAVTLKARPVGQRARLQELGREQ
eukprot:2243244-Amphidinium_carterae.1